MPNKQYNDSPTSLGEELFAEAASALFEDIDRIAMEISPEEAAEFEALQQRALSYLQQDYEEDLLDDDLSIAAEEENSYN